MTAPRTLNQWGYAAKIEPTNGLINAAGVGDGILLKMVPSVDVPQWLNPGDRGVTPGAAPRQNAPNSGRWGSYKLQAEGIGFGAAYSAGNKPHLDVLYQASGFSSTGSFTGGQENYLYAPQTQPTALTSVTSDVNLSGMLYRLYGAYADLSVASKGPEIPIWDFEMNGIMDPMTDAAIPAYSSYPAMANVPMKADAMTAKIGLFVAGANNTGLVLRSFGLKMGRSIKNHRANLASLGSSFGHAGFTPAYRKTEIEMVVERVALATTTPWNTATTLNPYKLAEDAVPVLLQLSVGAMQYKRWHIQTGTALTAGAPNPAAQAILTNVKDTADGPTATWTLTFECFASTYGASDEVSILYN